MIGIIDYGAGNLTSVKFAFDDYGKNSEICANPEGLHKYTHIVLQRWIVRSAMEKLIEETG